jgi:hypothetical protein
MHRYLVKIKDDTGVVHEKEIESLTINGAVSQLALELQEENPDIVFTKIDFELV